jgi:hypothetical protein
MMTRRKQIETLAVLALFLLVVARWQKNWIYVYAGVAVFLTGLVWKDFGRLVAKGWMKLGEVMGVITGKILLTLVFFLIVFPISLFAKRSGRSNIRLKPGGKTYFKDRNHVYTREDFENVW